MHPNVAVDTTYILGENTATERLKSGADTFILNTLSSARRDFRPTTLKIKDPQKVKDPQVTQITQITQISVLRALVAVDRERDWASDKPLDRLLLPAGLPRTTEELDRAIDPFS